MTRVLFATIPEKGHLNPNIGPAQQLRARGCQVAFYAPTDISAQLTLAGPFDFIGPCVQPPPAELSRGAAFAQHVRDPQWLRGWIHALLIEQVPASIAPLRDALRQWRPDVVVIDPLFYAAAIAAHAEGIPWAVLSNSLNPVLPDSLDSELLRTIRGLTPARARLFAQYGMHPDFRGCDVLSPSLTMALTTQAFTGEPPAGVTLIGPALAAGTRGDEPPFPWERLDPERPLIYMSLGSQIYYQPSLFNKVVIALTQHGTVPVQLVLAVGELLDSDLLPSPSDSLIIVRYAPQMAMLRRAAAFISHGGANSVMEALACGVPLLLTPLCNDQFHQAHFVERAGVGVSLDIARADTAQIADVVQALLRPGAIRDRVNQVAASYQRDGSADAARLIMALASKSHPATAS